MPKKRPQKSSFKVSVSDTLLAKFDKAIMEDGYDGRSELVVRLIRDFLEERDKQISVNTEYLILQEKKSLFIQQNSLNEE